MRPDHLLHATCQRGWLQLSFECIGDPTEHYHLIEKSCDCHCEMCSGDDPDHWGCEVHEDEPSFDGNPPCMVERGERCWVYLQDCPIEETLEGNWPKEHGWPVPVNVEYRGDGEWVTLYAGEADQ